MRSFYYSILALIISCVAIYGKNEDVCFVTLHPASAHHFARFTQELDQQEISWKILAADSAETILKQKKISHSKISVWSGKQGIHHLSLQEQIAIAKLIAKECKRAKIVITDISESFIAYVHQELALVSPAKRYVYYDNPEPYVPGEYSKCFSTLLNTMPDGVIFANQRFSKEDVFGEDHKRIDFEDLDRIGLGFYPLEDVTTLCQCVQDRVDLRKKLFKQLGMCDERQKILLYLGGANSVYFDQAFPFFVTALEKSATDPFFDNSLLLLQQHPRAKAEGKDLQVLLAKTFRFQVAISPLSPLEAAACSDLIYYYQTSLVPYLLLAKRPLLQVAHAPAADIGVRLQLIESVSTCVDLPVMSLRAIDTSYNDTILKTLKEEIGYDKNWPDHLSVFLQKQL